jgi:hypothetical protein
VDANFDSWETWTDVDQIRHIFFFILIQSDPEIRDRMYSNNETLEISITPFDAQEFAVNYSDPSIASEDSWCPVGEVTKTTIARTECNITRTLKVVENETIVLWI